MDQQPTGQAPTPPQAPLGAQPQAPNPYGQPPKKNTNLIIGIVIGVVVLIAIIATVLVLALSPKDDDTDKKDSTSTSKSDDTTKNDSADDAAKRAANAKTASSLTNFNVVCDTGSISNAADFAKPYKIAAFSKADDARSWSSVSLSYSADYYTKYDEYTKANVVACVTEKEGSAVKSTTCDFKSGDSTTTLDYYATSYDVTLYEAKSGKKIKDLGTVSGPATSCPYFVSYDKSNPKIVAKPDADAIDALLVKFSAE